MESLTAGMFNELYGNVIMPNASVRVPFGWSAIIFEMMASIQSLPTDVRAFLMLTRVAPNQDGLLVVDAYCVEDHMPTDGMQVFRDIVKRAVDRAAWTCERDGKPGWYSAGKGPRARILCAACQGNSEEMHVA